MDWTWIDIKASTDQNNTLVWHLPFFTCTCEVEEDPPLPPLPPPPPPLHGGGECASACSPSPSRWRRRASWGQMGEAGSQLASPDAGPADGEDDDSSLQVRTLVTCSKPSDILYMYNLPPSRLKRYWGETLDLFDFVFVQKQIHIYEHTELTFQPFQKYILVWERSLCKCILVFMLQYNCTLHMHLALHYKSIIQTWTNTCDNTKYMQQHFCWGRFA